MNRKAQPPPSALWRLIDEFRPYRFKIVLAWILGIIISLIQPASAKFSQHVIDSLKGGLDSGFFVWAPATLVGIFLLSGIAKYFHNVIRRSVNESVVLKLRASLLDKYVHFPLSALDQKRSGEMMSGIQNDLFQINTGFDTIWDLIKEPVTFISLLAAAFYFDWKLALSTLVVAPIVVGLFGYSGRAVKRYSQRNLEQSADLVGLSQEVLSGARVVKVFRLESILMDRFRSIQDRYFQVLMKSVRIQELATPLVEFIGALLMAGVITYGGYQIVHGEQTTGQLVGFLIALGLAQMPIKKLNNAYLRLKVAEAAAERVFGLLAQREEPRSTAIRRDKPTSCSIEYENACMHYGDRQILFDVSFGVQPGECVALVGRSGSGKSSIVNLLPRLYELSWGRILVGGENIAELDLADLRSRISLVTQEVFLFNASILENIRFGRTDASRQEIEAAADLAHCTEFIRRCPKGFDQEIGDRGVCLSGGERQRLAIARALLKDAPILVLDEATSNLDSKSESLVQDALEILMKGRTTLVVAHRLSTIRKANRILLLDGGRILESGTHSELIQIKGNYADLVQMQGRV